MTTWRSISDEVDPEQVQRCDLRVAALLAQARGSGESLLGLDREAVRLHG